MHKSLLEPVSFRIILDNSLRNIIGWPQEDHMKVKYKALFYHISSQNRDNSK